MSATTARGRAIARGVAAGWVHVGITFAVGPIYTALVLRALPRDDAGFWFVVLGLTVYFNLFDVGLGPTVTRFVAMARARGASDEARDGQIRATPAEVHRTASRMCLALAALVLAIGLGLGPWLLGHIHSLALTGERSFAWTLFVAGCAANILASASYATIVGAGAVAVPRLARAASTALGAALTAAAFALGLGMRGAAAALLTQNLVFFAAGTLLVGRVEPRVRADARFRMDVARVLLAPSLRWAGMNAGAVLILASGPIIVAAQAGTAVVPQFVVLRQLAEAIYLLAILPVQAAEPFASHAAAAADRDGVIDLLRQCVRSAVALIAVTVPAAMLLGRDVISAWVGAQHFAGAASLALMLLLYALEAHHVVHAAIVMATGRIVFLGMALLSGLLTVALGIWLTQRWGVFGMVAAMAVAQLATNNWYAPRYSLRLFGIRWRDYLGWLRDLAPLAVASVALGALSAALLHASGADDSIGAVLATLAVLAAVLLPSAWGTLAAGRIGLAAREVGMEVPQ